MTSALQNAAAKNQLVRIRTSFETLTGRVSTVSDSTFRVRGRTVVPGRVESLEVRISEPDRLLNGFLIGAAVGAVTLGPVAIDFAESMGEHQLSTWDKAATVLISALFGSLIGFAIDAAREGKAMWSPVYPPH